MVYELTTILQEERPEEIKKIIESLKGKVKSLSFWQKRKLAYKIKDQLYGSFYVCEFEIEPTEINQINKKLQANSNILRSLIIIKPKIKEKAGKKREVLPPTPKAPAFAEASAGKEELVPEKPVVEKIKEIKIEKITKPKVIKPEKIVKPTKIAPKKEETNKEESEEDRMKKLDEKLKKILGE